MSRELVVVAVGARTPVGLRADSSAAAIRADIGRVARHPVLIDAAGEPLRCGRAAYLPPLPTAAARLAALAVPALNEVLGAAFAHRPPTAPIPVFLAVPEPRPGWSTRDTEVLAHDLAVTPLPHGCRVSIEPIGGDHAGAVRGIEMAKKRIAERRDELCIVAGVDSLLDVETLAWLDRDRRLARAKVRTGFVPGEAAAMIAIAGAGTRGALGLPALARVRGVAIGREPRALDSDEGVLGEGLTEVVRRACQDLRVPEERIADIHCDINGQRYRTDEWAFTVLRLSSLFRDGTRHQSPASACGDVGAASAVLTCVLAVQAWRRKYAGGDQALVFASSPGGLRGAVLLERATR